jgi:hypothetical protein
MGAAGSGALLHWRRQSPHAILSRAQVHDPDLRLSMCGRDHHLLLLCLGDLLLHVWCCSVVQPLVEATADCRACLKAPAFST